MTENWKNTLDKGGFIAAIFMDFPKAFDRLNHNLLIAKLEILRISKRCSYLYEQLLKQ